MRLVGDRRVFSVEEITGRLATMFEGLRSFWVEAEVQDLRPSRTQVRSRSAASTSSTRR